MHPISFVLVMTVSTCLLAMNSEDHKEVDTITIIDTKEHAIHALHTGLCNNLIKETATFFPKKNQLNGCGSCQHCLKHISPSTYEIACLRLMAEHNDPPVLPPFMEDTWRKREPCLSFIFAKMGPIATYTIFNTLAIWGSLPNIIVSFFSDAPLPLQGIASLTSTFAVFVSNLPGEFYSMEFYKGLIEHSCKRGRRISEMKRWYKKVAETLLTEYMLNLGAIKQRKSSIVSLTSWDDGDRFTNAMLTETPKNLDTYLAMTGNQPEISFTQITTIASKITDIEIKLKNYLKEDIATMIMPLQDVTNLILDKKAHTILYSYVFSEDQDINLLKDLQEILHNKDLKNLASALFFEYK